MKIKLTKQQTEKMKKLCETFYKIYGGEVNYKTVEFEDELRYHVFKDNEINSLTYCYEEPNGNIKINYSQSLETHNQILDFYKNVKIIGGKR